MNEVLAQLVAFLKEASPLVWSTLIKQVYIEASANIAWSIGLLVVCVLLAKLGNYRRKQYAEDEYSDWQQCMWFLYLGSGIFGAIAFALVVSALMHFANPEFYAIRFILSNIGGG
jgi:hypothetical protein